MCPRIAHVISTRGVAGAERIMASLVSEGAVRGWEQLVLVPFAGGASGTLADVCLPATFREKPCDTPFGLPSVWRWTRRELSEFQPDIVHSWLFHATVTVASLPRPRNAALVVTHAYGEMIRVTRNAWARKPLDRWAGRRFDKVVGISDSVCRFLVNEYRYPPSKVRRISPGWQGDPMPPSASSEPTIVCIAKLRPEKGHTVLLAAFELVRRELPDARLLLAGDGDLFDELQERTKQMGLDDSVSFLGRVNDIWSSLAQAHVFAMASHSEAFGIAALEAMAAGLPVVAPDTGGLPELVEPGVTGALFPPGDHEQMAHHLIRLLKCPQERSDMGARARRSAESLRREVGTAEYYRLYEELLGHRQQRVSS